MKQRLNWVDALRGLTMVSVVMVHVLVSGFGVKPDNSALAILRGTFTLPLFFFVSGFFLFRPLEAWTRRRVVDALKVRSTALVGGTALFATLYFVVMRRADPLSWLPDGNFVEYWYTISLFQIFIWYLVAVGIGKCVAKLFCRSKSPEQASSCGERCIWVIITAAFCTSAVLPYTPWADTYWCYWWLNEKTALYFQFFAVGMAVRRWQEAVFRILDHPWTLTALIIAYISTLLGGWTYSSFWETHSPAVTTLFRETLSRYCGLLLVLRIFYGAREWFDGDTWLLRQWRLIGRRTLDIYFLHYFFIPRMRWVGPYLMRGNTFVPEFIAAAIVSLAILALILPLSRLLRTAPLIRNLLGDR